MKDKYESAATLNTIQAIGQQIPVRIPKSVTSSFRSHDEITTPTLTPITSVSAVKSRGTFIRKITRFFKKSQSSNPIALPPSLNSMGSANPPSSDYSKPASLTRANAYRPSISEESNPEISTPNVEATELPEYFVYIWGDNSKGQALHPPTHQILSIPSRVERLAHRCISYLECGAETTWIVSDGGDVWAGGCNQQGQISPCSAKEEPIISHARRLEEFEALRVKSVACGEEHTVVVLESGTATSYGTNEFGQLGHGEGTTSLFSIGPKKLIGMNLPVSQVACGTYHTLVLSITGLPDTNLGFQASLKPIPSLVGLPVVQVVAGPEHSMALSLGGKIFSWGKNKKGRLGIGSDAKYGSIVPQPICIEFEGIPLFKQLATGPTHSAAIGPKGSLYMCGDNSDGQLGLSPENVKNVDLFTLLKIDTSKVRSVACGDRHTAIISCHGELMCFGRNDEGQLGISKDQMIDEVIWRPTKINFVDSSMAEVRQDLFFYAVATGRDHTAAVAVRFPPEIHPSKVSSSVSDISNPVYISREPSHISDAFHASLSRLGSKTAILKPLKKACFHQNSVCSSPLTVMPSIIHRSGAAARPTLYSFQHLKSSDNYCLKRGPLDAIEKNELQKELASLPADNKEFVQPAGCSVGEILSLIESVRSSANREEAFRLLKKRLTSVYSDPQRLNCSFLLPGKLGYLGQNFRDFLSGRLPIMDIEGVEEIFDEIEKLIEKDAILQSIYISAMSCMDAVEPFAQYFRCSDQIQFVPLLLQLRFLNSPTATNMRYLNKLVAIVFNFPSEGRRALVNLLKIQYPSNVFGKRLVDHFKIYLNKTIETVPRSLAPTSTSYQILWKGVIIYQLLFLSSVEYGTEQRARSIELTGRAQIVGKIPLELFVLESVYGNIDLVEELTAFRKYAPPLDPSKHDIIGLPQIVRVPIGNRRHMIFRRAAEEGSVTQPTPIITTTQTDRSNAQDPPQPTTTTAAVITTSGDSTMQIGSVGGPTIDEFLKSKKAMTSTTSSKSPTVTMEITGRPRGIFDPSEAITVTELEPHFTTFLAHQNICPLRFKRDVIMVEAAANQERTSMQSMFFQGQPFFFMPVRRNTIVEDALNIILCSPIESMLRPLKVIFDGEEGVDGGGLKREFFNILVQTLFNQQYGMFVYNAEARTFWFNKSTIDTEREFFLVGVILGLALYNDNLLNLQFPNVVWKKLQDIDVCLDDLVDVFPIEGRSFANVLDWPADQIDLFNSSFEGTTFDVNYDFFGELRTVELKPNGSQIHLNYENRTEYVHLYIQYLLTDSIKPQFEAFKRGFLHFQTMLLKTLSPEELHLLVCGSPDLDFDDLKKGVKYEGYQENEEYIEQFWDIVQTFDIHQKKQFLRFCTGTDRVPLGGLKELGLKIQKNGGEPTDKLPTAYTCFNSLLIPLYSSKEKLKRLLILAIEQFQGFGLQ